MTLDECTQCGEMTLKPGHTPEFLCSACREQLIKEINRIDRDNDRYTKRGKIKNRLNDIPDEAIPEEIALQIEEVADPEIDDRQYMKGSIEEVKQLDDKEIFQTSNDKTDFHRGKVELKKRFR